MARNVWQTVQAPDFTSAMRGFEMASRMMSEGFDAANKAVDTRNESVTTRDQRTFQQRLAGIDDASVLASQLRDGFLSEDLKYLRPEDIEKADSRINVLLEREGSKLRNEGQSLSNRRTSWQFNLDQNDRRIAEQLQPLINRAQMLAAANRMDEAKALLESEEYKALESQASPTLLATIPKSLTDGQASYWNIESTKQGIEASKEGVLTSQQNRRISLENHNNNQADRANLQKAQALLNKAIRGSWTPQQLIADPDYSNLSAAMQNELLTKLAAGENIMDWGIPDDSDNASWALPDEWLNNITSEYGPRKAPTPGASTNHLALDFGLRQGTNIMAPAGGRARVRYDRNLGSYVEIDHGNGLVSKYGHLSGTPVGWKRDEWVNIERGTYIGRSGGAPGTPGAGTSTGAHLHLRVEKDGVPIDPRTAGRYFRDTGGGRTPLTESDTTAGVSAVRGITNGLNLSPQLMNDFEKAIGNNPGKTQAQVARELIDSGALGGGVRETHVVNLLQDIMETVPLVRNNAEAAGILLRGDLKPQGAGSQFANWIVAPFGGMRNNVGFGSNLTASSRDMWAASPAARILSNSQTATAFLSARNEVAALASRVEEANKEIATLRTQLSALQSAPRSEQNSARIQSTTNRIAALQNRRDAAYREMQSKAAVIAGTAPN